MKEIGQGQPNEIPQEARVVVPAEVFLYKLFKKEREKGLLGKTEVFLLSEKADVFDLTARRNRKMIFPSGGDDAA